MARHRAQGNAPADHAQAVERGVVVKHFRQVGDGGGRRQGHAGPAEVFDVKLVDPRAEKAVLDFVFALNDAQGVLFRRQRIRVRPAEEKALAVRHVKAHQRGQLGFRFNAFGDEARVGKARKLLHAADKGLAHQVFVHPAHQLHIQFDEMGLHVRNEVEAGIPRPGVVNADLVVLGFIVFNNTQESLQISY